ncbi:MAG: hypothetical protein WB987_15275 [Candidatus Acidiferrales bacterium]
MNDWEELDRALNELVRSAEVEIREDGEWLAELASLHFELRRAGKDALVHLWSDEKNLTRRVVRVKESLADRIVLEVQRLGRSKPGRLEFLRTDSQRPAGRITREQFRARFERILAERFPDACAEALSAAPDLEHSFSGVYVRGRMHEGTREWAFLAASRSENAAAIDGMLGFGLLWMDWTRNHIEKRAIEGLRLFVPEGTSRMLRERVLALSSTAGVEIYEFSEPDSRMQKLDPADAGNLESCLVARPDVESTLAAARDAFTRVSTMVDGTAEAMETRVPAKSSEAVFRFRGLEFARWTREGVLFGLGDARERLTSAKEHELERMIRQLDLHRSSLAEDTRHYLYRAAPERWLETLVLEDPSRIDAQLNPACLYSQVPALAAGDRGVLDLLGVTRRGRLVVIELKASEDIQMPIQAVDYWLRVRRHQREGDFQRFGYFSGIEVDSKPPLVWLVAPGLRFHAATETLLKYLSPEIQISRIGVNENW